MFKRCFICLLPKSCIRGTEPQETIACGFYTGAVREVGQEIFVVALEGQKKREEQLMYIVPRNDKKPGSVDDVVYLLKEEDREILTIPASLPNDEYLCSISTLTSTYLTLLDPSLQLLVFPYPNSLTSPQKYVHKHVLLVRNAESLLFDIVIEQEKKGKMNGSGHSNSTVLMTDDSLRPSDKSPRKKLEFDEDDLKDVELIPDISGKHNFSFSNPYTIKEEDHQSSSILTLEGDSGGECMDLRPLGLPDVGSLPSEETSHKRIPGIKPTSKALLRVQVSPYRPADKGGSLIAYPERIGRNRLPLRLLKQPSVSQTQIDTIELKAGAWRCAGPGAGSFFWCVAVGWVEHLARGTTEIGDVDQIISSILQPSKSSFEIRPGFEQSSETVLKLLQDLRSWKYSNRTTAIVRLQRVFQQHDALLSLEKFLRMVCINYIEKLAITPELSHIVTENLNQQTHWLAGEGVDFSSLTFMSVADSLSAGLVLIKMEDDNSVSVEEYQTEESESCCQLMLLQQDDHFHLLYTREDIAVDGYDLDTHCFEVLDALNSS